MPVNPDLENYLLESGSVKGIKDVSPPLRLALILLSLPTQVFRGIWKFFLLTTEEWM